MECERLAQRMQALFGSFNEDDNEKSDIEQLQRDYKEKLVQQMHHSEYCQDSHSTQETQSWFPWQEHELCRTKSAMGADIWLNGTTLQEEQLNSNEGTPMTCLDAAGSQSPATDRKSNRIMSVHGESDYSMHHQEMYYTHHRHLHHSHPGGPLGMHATHTEPTRFEALLSLDDDASHSSHCDAHHSFDYPHHHQHYRLHHHHHHHHNHHRNGHQFTDYPHVNLFQNGSMPEETVGCSATVPQFIEPMNYTVDHDADDHDKPLTLEDLKEWHRKKMALDNSLHNACSLQLRVMQWLNESQNDSALLTPNDESLTSEHVL